MFGKWLGFVFALQYLLYQGIIYPDCFEGIQSKLRLFVSYCDCPNKSIPVALALHAVLQRRSGLSCKIN